MPSNDVLTRNDNSDLAVRTVSATESSTVVNPNDVYTRDENGNLAVRVVGGGDKHNLGWYATESALTTAHLTAEAGDWAIVGATDTVWIWDTDNSEWKDSDQKGQVESVNNKTGTVVLTAEDVNAIPQYSTVPTASSTNVDNIIQYTGTTDSTYTNGYFYKCVSDGQTPATYSWTRIDVQPIDAVINDNSTSLTETWSASKLNTMIGNIETLLSQI